MPADQWQARRRSFGAAAGAYAAARPDYPPEAVRWVIGTGARQVLDLGAGTGKLTGQLVGAYAVTAVEPSDRMRAELVRRLPQATVLAGSAEAIPLPDGSVDAVLAAQAFHWFDLDRAVPEIARVLRPGGRLGLLWNVRDETEPWVAALSEALGEEPESLSDAAHRKPFASPLFRNLEQQDFRHPGQRLDLPTLLELVRSRSYFITQRETDRAATIARVTALVASHPDLAGRDEFVLPYVTDCWRATRASTAHPLR